MGASGRRVQARPSAGGSRSDRTERRNRIGPLIGSDCLTAAYHPVLPTERRNVLSRGAYNPALHTLSPRNSWCSAACHLRKQFRWYYLVRFPILEVLAC